MPRVEHDTPKRCRFYNAFDDKSNGLSLNEICDLPHIKISPKTGRDWLRKRQKLGSAAYRRTRSQGQHLGRPPAIDYSSVNDLTDPDHPLHFEPLQTVSNSYEIPVSNRTLRRHLHQQGEPIRRYMCRRSSAISAINKTRRVAHGVEHRGKTTRDFWQHVHFNSVDLTTLVRWSGALLAKAPRLWRRNGR